MENIRDSQQPPPMSGQHSPPPPPPPPPPGGNYGTIDDDPDKPHSGGGGGVGVLAAGSETGSTSDDFQAMNISTGAAQAYAYIVNLSGVSTFLVWGAISFVHMRFRAAWAAQGHTPEDLPFRSLGYPWNAYFGLGANAFLALVQGWSTLAPFDAATFVDAYILLPLFPIIYFGYKLVFKTKVRRALEIDLVSGRRRDLEEDKEVGQGTLGGEALPLWRRLWNSF